MDSLTGSALQTWYNTSYEGVLVVDPAGNIRMINSRLRQLLKLQDTPQTLEELIVMAETCGPEISALLNQPARVQWGNVRIETYPPQRLIWQQIPLIEEGQLTGSLVVFRDASTQGQLELAKQSFLSMISHDLRTPLSTILGFAELLHNNRGQFSEKEQTEILSHIIKNANQLSRYTQIAMDIMYLEADTKHFETEAVHLNRLVQHWLSDAHHRFGSDQVIYHNGSGEEPMTRISPPALHRILYILVEFALSESPSSNPIDIHVDYDDSWAHVIIQHQAPRLTSEEAAVLFRLLHPRDLSESGRPQLHRMQLYVANLLAERQNGSLTLRDQTQSTYELDLAMPIASASLT
jgi:K+-sensing histidine kinase KdpD